MSELDDICDIDDNFKEEGNDYNDDNNNNNFQPNELYFSNDNDNKFPIFDNDYQNQDNPESAMKFNSTFKSGKFNMNPVNSITDVHMSGANNNMSSNKHNNNSFSSSNSSEDLKNTGVKEKQNLPEGPILLIQFNKQKYILNNDAIEILKTIKDEVVVVSIVGKARTGKSYLLNLLLGCLNNKNNLPKSNEAPKKCFEVASSINSCTRGIWLWNTPKNKPNSNAKILFIDSEGTSSSDLSTKTYDSKIFGLVILLSSLFIYNTVGNIDEKSIGDLALAAHISNCIAASGPNVDKDQIVKQLAPKFIWTIRDFSLDKVNPDTGEEISSNEYLEICLNNKISGKNSNENNLIRENILKYFHERECVTLPRPVEDEEELQNLMDVPFDKLRVNFQREFLELKKKIYVDSKPKRMSNNKVITGEKLASLIVSFVDSINNGAVPNVSNAWDNIIKTDIESQYDKSIKSFKKSINELISQNYNISLIASKQLQSISQNLTFSKKNTVNELLKDLYKLKYKAIELFKKIAYTNNDIYTNNEYNNIFNTYYEKLVGVIDKEMNNNFSNYVKELNKNIKNIINKNTKNISTKLSTEQYSEENNFESLISDYLNYYNEIRLNECYPNKEMLNLLNENDFSTSSDIFHYIASTIKINYSKKSKALETELRRNELEMQFNKITGLEEINNTYLQRINLLNNDCLRKEMEINDLNNKLDELKKKRDDIRYNKKNQMMMSLRKKNKLNVSKDKALVQSKCEFEGEEKLCDCCAQDSTCYIF